MTGISFVMMLSSVSSPLASFDMATAPTPRITIKTPKLPNQSTGPIAKNKTAKKKVDFSSSLENDILEAEQMFDEKKTVAERKAKSAHVSETRKKHHGVVKNPLTEFQDCKSIISNDLEKLESILRFVLASPILSEAAWTKLASLPALSGLSSVSAKVEKLISLYQTEVSFQKNEMRQLEFSNAELERKADKYHQAAAQWREKCLASENEAELWKQRAIRAESKLNHEETEERALQLLLDDTCNLLDSVIDKSGKLAALEASSYHSDSSFAEDY